LTKSTLTIIKEDFTEFRTRGLLPGVAIGTGLTIFGVWIRVAGLRNKFAAVFIGEVRLSEEIRIDL
jgi:hypothetical protein